MCCPHHLGTPPTTTLHPVLVRRSHPFPLISPFCPGHPKRAMQQQQQSATDAVLTPQIKNKILAPVTDSGVHDKPQSVPSDCVLLAACQVCCPLLPSEETDKLVLSPFSHNWILSDDAFYTVID